MGAEWSETQLHIQYNRELRGILGNLLSRVTTPKLHATLLKPSTEATIPVDGQDGRIREMLQALPELVDTHFSELEIGKALDCIVDCLNEVRIVHTHLGYVLMSVCG